MQHSTIELVTFKPKAGVSIEQLEATGSAMEAFLTQQPGFIYRSLSADEEGCWYDIIYWRSKEEATRAAEQFSQHPAGQAMLELIDMSATKMRHMLARCETMSESNA